MFGSRKNCVTIDRCRPRDKDFMIWVGTNLNKAWCGICHTSSGPILFF